jgi:hypothetical protein
MNYLSFILPLLIPLQLAAQSAEGYLTQDGSWCWFSDPRAIIVDNKIYTGWVKSNGTIEAAAFNLDSKEITPYELYYQLERDDHDNPAFTLTASGDILAMYTRHSKKDLFINRLKAPPNNGSFTGAQLIHPLSKEELAKFPLEHVTYANPYRLEKENNRIYCFGRWTGYKPNMMWSDDDGATWSKSRVFITNYPFDPANRPYVKYHSDGQSRIHMVFTDGHPRNEPANSVYYAYYENGAFYKANGQQIATMDQLPFEPKDASVVYTSNETEGRAWIADIAQDTEGNPTILFTKSPTELNHEYWYAQYTKKGWASRKICDSGKWFPQTEPSKTEPEPHYFGGMTLHPKRSNIVFLSRQINDVFEIERWSTDDKGKTWTKKAVTRNSTYDNVRPYVPRGLPHDAPEVVLWMENQRYIHYTDYKTSIKYAMLEY